MRNYEETIKPVDDVQSKHMVKKLERIRYNALRRLECIVVLEKRAPKEKFGNTQDQGQSKRYEGMSNIRAA